MVLKKEISLLPDEENNYTTSARIVKWLTTVGRFVIVFTELIVISAFLSRFWLDRTNSDLSDIIRQQKAILESTAPFEKDYVLLQRRLKSIKEFYKNQPEFIPKIDALVESTPPDISFNNLKIKFDKSTKDITADLQLYAYDESSIVNFITNLIVNPNISKVNINTIERRPKETRYIVNISTVFVKEKK